MKVKFDPDYITEQLSILAGKYGKDNRSDIEEAIYQFKAIAENEYNSDYYRIFYHTLEIIAVATEFGVITANIGG